MHEYKEQDFFEEDIDSIDGEDIVEYDITSSPRDLTPANIVDMVDAGIIELPLFQRNYVWDIKKASKLVESLILGLPVPELFFYSEGDENTTYKIIDGQQRLLSIYFFVKGRFPKNSESRIIFRNNLNDVDNLDDMLKDNHIFRDFVLQLNDKGEKQTSRYNGKSFSALDKDVQIKFRLRRYLRTVVVRQNKPDDSSSSMFEIFNRLNTGGTPLTHQEIRASLYYCNFYEMLVILNNNNTWRELLGKPSQDLHSNDIELILRSFALLKNGERYTPKMVTFLNDFSRESKRFESDYIGYLQEVFISFVESCSILEKRAFFRNGRFSKTLFESVFVASCKESYNSRELVNFKIDSNSFQRLKNDTRFISLLQSSSSSSESVKTRINIATEMLTFVKEN